MVVGNVIGSNIANIALVFGLTLAVLFFKKEYFVAQNDIKTKFDVEKLIGTCLSQDQDFSTTWL